MFQSSFSKIKWESPKLILTKYGDWIIPVIPSSKYPSKNLPRVKCILGDIDCLGPGIFLKGWVVFSLRSLWAVKKSFQLEEREESPERRGGRNWSWPVSPSLNTNLMSSLRQQTHMFFIISSTSLKRVPDRRRTRLEPFWLQIDISKTL